jgi:penicillin-binding protein 2
MFEQLRKDDPRLRAVSLIFLMGLLVLLVGLWWVQVVSARRYQANLENQSYRTVRIPAVRGKLLDTDGVVLAENRPTYNISLYLEELSVPFRAAFNGCLNRKRAELKQRADAEVQRLGRKLNKEERKRFVVTGKDRIMLQQESRLLVVSNLVFSLAQVLREPVPFNPEAFERHYKSRLALPYPVMRDISPSQIARFQERTIPLDGADLEVQSTRFYPHGSLAAHVLGRLQRDDDSTEGEEAFFSYRLPDYRGLVGLEAIFDKRLRGSAGAKSVLVNNVGYRQTENVWLPAEPGQNLILTIHTGVQEAAEKGLQSAFGPTTRGAVVVMDVQNGDILALASSPTLDPNHFVQGFPRGEWQRITDLRAELNRATQERYAPGSSFKLVIGLAALEAGLNPNEVHIAHPNPNQPSKAAAFVRGKMFKDTAPPGEYNFKRALKLSSNSYFIAAGLLAGPENIVRMAQQFHLGERTGLMPRQETAGFIPPLDQVRRGWRDVNTANISIGQDPILVTPLQIAVVTAAIANDGKVLWPRLAKRALPQDPILGERPEDFPGGRVRHQLEVAPRHLSLMRAAMLADVEDSDGTGTRAAVPGYRVCGKTGTAQVENIHSQLTGHITWFASFAPYEQPKYAVVVMVENGVSGGATCAPIAGKVYTVLRDYELSKTRALARTN